MSPSDWESFLAPRLDRRVGVRYSRARSAPVQAEYEGRDLRLRLHRFFAAAPPAVGEALAAWLKSGRRARRACRELDAWIDARLAELPPRRPRAVALRPRGRCHDLAALRDALVAEEFVLEFRDDPPPGVTWGRRTRSRARHSLQLGSFDPARNVARVHPVLDQSGVPEWFVRYVLFHEILHAALPSRTACGGRTVHHGPDFRAREREYKDYARALRWQKRHLGRLIRSARDGAPPRPRLVQGLLFRL